jgi:hypothetical protein
MADLFDGDSAGRIAREKRAVANVIPFGKYKGQPIEAMAADAGYMEWLASQSWFRDKYENIYTLIINNFAEPSETPAHNVLQVLFLDNGLAARAVECAENKMEWKFVWPGAIDLRITERKVSRVSFEVSAVDVLIKTDIVVCARFRDYNWPRQSGYQEITETFNESLSYAVEIKPSVGDDYPVVLRQIRNNLVKARNILFLEQYTGTGATRDQFVEIFRRSGIAVVFRSEV